MSNEGNYKEKYIDYRIFVKNYEKIRYMFRKCYLSGLSFKNIEESKRSYSEKLKIIKNLFDEKFLKAEIIDKIKYHNFNLENHTKIKNFLYNSYLIKTVDVEILKSYFYILQVINGKEIEQSKLIYRVCELIGSEKEKYNSKNDAVQFLNRIIKYMVETGVLKCKKSGKKNILSIQDDILADFSEEEILKIMDAVSFYSNLSVVGVPGNFVLDVLSDYLRGEMNYNCDFESSFTFKENFLAKILDEEVIIKILESMEKEKTIKFTYNNKLKHVIPIKIVTEYNMGRQYLIAQSVDSKVESKYRIDKISSCKNGENLKKLNIDIKNIYIAKNIPVEIEFDICKEDSVYRRLKREQNGDIKKLDENKYLYTLEVEDPVSLIPWIMSFGDIAKVRKSNKHNLDKKIDDNYREIFKNYNIDIEGMQNGCI